jgi:hypothetical protein
MKFVEPDPEMQPASSLRFLASKRTRTCLYKAEKKVFTSLHVSFKRCCNVESKNGLSPRYLYLTSDEGNFHEVIVHICLRSPFFCSST